MIRFHTLYIIPEVFDKFFFWKIKIPRMLYRGMS